VAGGATPKRRKPWGEVSNHNQEKTTGKPIRPLAKIHTHRSGKSQSKKGRAVATPGIPIQKGKGNSIVLQMKGGGVP